MTWEILAQAGRIADAIVEYVRVTDWVTFVELQDAFAAYIPTRGDGGMCSSTVENVVFWSGMSTELMDAIDEARERLFVYPTVALAYMVDGGMLTLPVAHKPPKGGYKTPHWLPTVFSVTPMAQKGTRATAPVSEART